MSIIFFFLFRTVSTLHALVVSPISLYIFLFDEGVNEDLIWWEKHRIGVVGEESDGLADLGSLQTTVSP